ncbi:MAG: hypothetical protein CMM93_02585 [Rickettsiales bacterium]|nr:hypothetical protein [Rickettsiales bacterium]
MLRLMQQPGLSGEEYGEFATAIESWLNRYQSYTQLEESYHGFHLLKRSAPSQAFLDAKSAATLLAKLGPLEKDSLYAAAEDVRGRHTDKSPWAR